MAWTNGCSSNIVHVNHSSTNRHDNFYLRLIAVIFASMFLLPKEKKKEKQERRGKKYPANLGARHYIRVVTVRLSTGFNAREKTLYLIARPRVYEENVFPPSKRPIRELDRIQRILEPSNRLDEFSSFRGNRTIMISKR